MNQKNRPLSVQIIIWLIQSAARELIRRAIDAIIGALSNDYDP